MKIAEARAKKYYQKGKKKVPKKYQNKNKYDFKRWSGRGKNRVLKPNAFLHNLKTNKRVVANPVSAGTPRYAPISGQRIWGAHTTEWDRARMMGGVKEAILRELEKLDKADFPPPPIRIGLAIQDFVKDPIVKNQKWDLDNRVIIWQKAFQDCLIGNPQKNQDTGKMEPTTTVFYEDDNITFITAWEYEFTAIDGMGDNTSLSKPMLSFIIEHDARPGVQNLDKWLKK